MPLTRFNIERRASREYPWQLMATGCFQPISIHTRKRGAERAKARLIREIAADKKEVAEQHKKLKAEGYYCH